MVMSSSPGWDIVVLVTLGKPHYSSLCLPPQQREVPDLGWRWHLNDSLCLNCKRGTVYSLMVVCSLGSREMYQACTGPIIVRGVIVQSVELIAGITDLKSSTLFYFTQNPWVVLRIDRVSGCPRIEWLSAGRGTHKSSRCLQH